MPDFWLESGYRLLDSNDDGHLLVTDDFLRAYLMRAELEPVEESCAPERALHGRLLEDPRSPVAPLQISAMADADVRENYTMFLAFRERLLAAGTLENCYLGLFKEQSVTVPPMFIAQITQIILRNILGATLFPLRVRCAELLFRDQKISLQDGGVLAADAIVVDMKSAPGGALSSKHGGPQTKTVELDVLNDDNAELYWVRSDAFDTALDLRPWGQANEALCRVLEAWVAHFYGLSVHIHPLDEINDQNWKWYIGLDAEASHMLNDLYEGKAMSEDRRRRLLSLFVMDIDDKELMAPDIAGCPIYLGMAMTEGNLLRLKPQNILINLPLAQTA
ncbi:MAG: DUF6352 family protein [Rhodospirillales bacterium]